MSFVLRALRAVRYWLYTAFRFVLNALFANETCICCGDASFAIPLCRPCQKAHYDDIKFGFPRCVRCGRYLMYHERKNRFCSDCVQRPVLFHTNSVFPLYRYEKTGREVLSLWKLSGIRSFGDFFAHKCFEVWKKRFFGMPIVPVPPRKNKLFKTGWDQVRDVVWTLRFRYNVPVYELLVRRDDTEQKTRSRKERIERAAGRYVLSTKYRRKTLPHTVVLLDDIMTTGATIENCAAVLRESGVECVNAMSVFFVP